MLCSGTSSGEKDRVPSLDASSMISAGGRPRSSGTASSHRACILPSDIKTAHELGPAQPLCEADPVIREVRKQRKCGDSDAGTHLRACGDVGHQRRAHQRQEVRPVLRAGSADLMLTPHDPAHAVLESDRPTLQA